MIKYISPRRGTVLAFTCQLLLQSLGGVKEEESLTSSFQEIDNVVRRVLDATFPRAAVRKQRISVTPACGPQPN